ncbi:enoyl-CoA hydratase-related protein [Candidatus Amarobacter glycogenicus]|uniref:enoyl-CoA hydratase/isomerase family protein n=1 Tax=Candidatus Amarobacter glycogenicus TaxID=3140699 RepID=UPI002A0B9EA9|nr:enoyl-CoA hydratase/isomerase family protein [Dehalococcoidia bacterium]
MADYTDIEVEIEDPVGVLRINRPEKLNAFTYHTLAEIQRGVDELVADRRVVGIVITGTGRAFSAGLDSQALVDVTAAEASEPGSRSGAPGPQIPGLFTNLLAVPKPVVAAVNGVAAGGGFVLAAKCDVRIAAAGASFTTVFMKRGLIGEHGMTWLLPRLVGPGRAMDLMMTSKRIDASEAQRIGLVEYVCEEGEDVVERAKAYIRDISGSIAPLAFAETKSLMYAHMGADYERAFREADVVQWRAVGRPDATEGARSLIEKRAPNFERLG